VTPLFGSLLVVIGGTISEYCKYAFPAYLVMLMACFCLYVLQYKFNDYEKPYSEVGVSTAQVSFGTVAVTATANANTNTNANSNSKAHIVEKESPSLSSEKDGAASPSKSQAYTPPLLNTMTTFSEIDKEKIKSINNDTTVTNKDIEKNAGNGDGDGGDGDGTPLVISPEDQLYVFRVLIFMNFATRGE
jgi:hypothetical protein